MGVVVVVLGDNFVTGLLIFTKVDVSLTLSVSAPVSISLSVSLCASASGSRGGRVCVSARGTGKATLNSPLPNGSLRINEKLDSRVFSVYDQSNEFYQTKVKY